MGSTQSTSVSRFPPARRSGWPRCRSGPALKSTSSSRLEDTHTEVDPKKHRLRSHDRASLIPNRHPSAECATRVPDSDLRGGSISPVTRSALVIPSGYASQEVASFIAQLDDLLERQHDQTRKLTPVDLEWQPAPGMNTIGMLMAHQAVIEVAWTG